MAKTTGTNLKSLLSSLGGSITTICIIGYLTIVGPANEAGERERAAHAAVRAHKTNLHAQLTIDKDPYGGDDIYDEPVGLTADDIARMIAIPTSEVVEWAFGPKPPWWEIGSLDDWGDMPPKELDAKIHEAMNVLSAGQTKKSDDG